MPDNNLLNSSGANFDDFELPPLPVKPPSTPADSPAAQQPLPPLQQPLPDMQQPLPPLQQPLPNMQQPLPNMQQPLPPINTAVPPMPPLPSAPKAVHARPSPPGGFVPFDLSAGAGAAPMSPPPPSQPVSAPQAVHNGAAAPGGFVPFDLSSDAPAAPSPVTDLPPMPKSVPKPPPDKLPENPPPVKEDSKFDFNAEYEPDDLDKIDVESINMEDLSKSLKPIRSRSEENSRSVKETAKMNDLVQEVGNAPILDDLSNDYAAAEKKSESLTDKARLDDDEKRALKQKLAEDLGRRPENFNARASKNYYNKLMEEKRLKAARKGFAISVLPILMGLASAAICYFKMNWDPYNWFIYVAPFMVLGALLLLVKSNHMKILAVSLYAVCALIYVGPGLIMFTLKNGMGGDGIMHVVFAIAAVALNVISILILIKNESVNAYYSSSIKKRR